MFASGLVIFCNTTHKWKESYEKETEIDIKHMMNA